MPRHHKFPKRAVCASGAGLKKLMARGETSPKISIDIVTQESLREGFYGFLCLKCGGSPQFGEGLWFDRMESELDGTKMTLVEACHSKEKWVAMERDTRNGPTSFSSMWPNKPSTA